MKPLFFFIILGTIFLACVCWSIFEFYKPKIKQYLLWKVYSLEAHKQLYDIRHKQRVLRIAKRDTPKLLESYTAPITWHIGYDEGEAITISTEVEVIE